tara:strand:+ start:1595 stop:2041 length:447 start_codon:yes stop_codon:yes gene_type:complete
MAELKEALILTNDKSTLLKEVEGQLTVEHMYAGESVFTKVVDEAIRGDYRTASGMFPGAPTGKEIEKERIQFKPDLSKYPFYIARTRVYEIQARRSFDKKFAIGEKKLTATDKKVLKEQRKVEAKNILLDKLSRRNAKNAEAAKASAK